MPWHAGKYELLAVLTHKGRSADSGHYVSWAKQDDGKWIQFDDEEMIVRKEEEIVGLSGGGDWHMAYLLLYRAVRVASPPATVGPATGTPPSTVLSEAPTTEPPPAVGGPKA